MKTQPGSPTDALRVAFPTASSQGSERTTTFLLPVVLSATARQPVTVGYAVTPGTATQGGDYTLTNGALTFSPGQTSQTITVGVIDDTQPETNETFRLTLSQPTNAELGAVTVHTYTILDDEQLPVPVAAGDANRDFQFDQLDIVQVLQGAKYLTGGPATFEEGDWNGDGVFDQLDIVEACSRAITCKGPTELGSGLDL